MKSNSVSSYYLAFRKTPFIQLEKIFTPVYTDEQPRGLKTYLSQKDFPYPFDCHV